MRRFYLPSEKCNSSTLLLTDREAYHASEVIRVRRGERVIVLDGAGREFICEVFAVSSREVSLRVISSKSVSPSPSRITLLQAVPKGKTFGLIVEKATELGAHRIVPILSERVVMQLDEESSAGKVEKWQQIAIESIKQCGSRWLPIIESPVTPQEYLARKEHFELALVASLHDAPRSPREVINAFVSEKGDLPKTICVWIGPEGDFTSAEMSVIKAAGASPITLGPLVLRSETAAIYCLSVLSYEVSSSAPLTP
jgi:16S rRNA (uracil1498-N3)-methyltransferase